MTGDDTLGHGRLANAQAHEAETDEIRVDAGLAVDLW
jgi:hypothetical protein